MAEAKSWNSDIKTWKERNAFLFKNDIMSDCSFIVTDGKKKTIIPAHKYVLGGNSEDFYNLFYLMKTSDVIPIEDISAEILTKFLEFLYTEKITMTMEHVEEILKLARRYSVHHLEEFCGEFLAENVNQYNAVSVMDKYSDYLMPSLMDKCAKIISESRLFFESPSFLKISLRTLTELLKSEELMGIEEINIFKVVNKWADNFCKENNQMINSENKRLAVKPALEYIRFASMSMNDFAICTVNNPILTAAECFQVLQFIGSNGVVNCNFSDKKRQVIDKKAAIKALIKIFKFNLPEINSTTLTLNRYKVFDICVNKAIRIHGFGILGRKLPFQYRYREEKFEDFVIQLKDKYGNLLLEGFPEIDFDGTKKTYSLQFDNSMLLKPNNTYHAYIHRQSPNEFIHHCINQPNIVKDFDGVRFTINNGGICTSIIYSEHLEI